MAGPRALSVGRSGLESAGGLFKHLGADCRFVSVRIAFSLSLSGRDPGFVPVRVATLLLLSGVNLAPFPPTTNTSSFRSLPWGCGAEGGFSFCLVLRLLPPASQLPRGLGCKGLLPTSPAFGPWRCAATLSGGRRLSSPGSAEPPSGARYAEGRSVGVTLAGWQPPGRRPPLLGSASALPSGSGRLGRGLPRRRKPSAGGGAYGPGVPPGALGPFRGPRFFYACFS